MENKVFSYQGNPVTFNLTGEGTMINATQMAKAFGKRPTDYLRLPSTIKLMEALKNRNSLKNSEVRFWHNAENQLVRIYKGGNINGGGSTYFHEDIALDFAQWLSVDFKLWCNDRIKEIMKYGFTATPDKLEEMIANPDLVIKLAQNLKQERAEKERLQHQNNLQKEQLTLSAPKIEYYEDVLQSQSLIPIRIIAKELGMSAMALNKLLREMKVQYKQGDTWVLYSKYQGREYTKTKTHTYTDSLGNTRTSILTVWTEKGRQFIHSIVKAESN